MFRLPNLTALHFDGGSPETIADSVARATDPKLAIIDDPDLFRWVKLNAKSGWGRFPPSKKIQDSFFRRIGRCFVNPMQHLADQSFITKGFFSPLRNLTTDGYLNQDQEKHFGKALHHFPALMELQLLHGDGLDNNLINGDLYFAFTPVVAPVQQHLTSLHTLRFMETGVDGYRRWPVSKPQDIAALNGLSRPQNLQNLSLCINCRRLHLQDLINARNHMSLSSITALDLNWIDYGEKEARYPLRMELPSIPVSES